MSASSVGTGHRRSWRAAAAARVQSELGVKLLNLGFRLASMAGKFGLSLFLARYLDLADLGVYGIIFGVSMFMVVLLGGRIDHELSRRIVLEGDAEGARLMRDQSLFFVLNFLAALPCFAVAGALGLPDIGMAIALCTWAICCLESYANLLYVNASALGRSLPANMAFFVRSGLWALIAMVALALFPSLRTLWTVLLLWVAGSGFSILLSLPLVGVRAWPSLRQAPVDWPVLRRGLSISVLIWIGSIGLAGGTYLDRLVLSGYLDLKIVGVATYYASFGNAVVALIASSSFAVVLRKLVRIVDGRDWRAFWQELRGLAWYTGVLGLVLCVAIAVAIPGLSAIAQKPEIYANRHTLWALMAAAMLRLLAEGVFAGLYALRLDAYIWGGNLAFLGVSLVANILLIGRYGLIGLGVANILAALFLLLFRSWGLIANAPRQAVAA